MQRTILVTGSTDGIGLATAWTLVAQGHHVLLHGRNEEKLTQIEQTLSKLPGGGRVNSYLGDLSRMADVEKLARVVATRHDQIDVLINNAGVYSVSNPITDEGLDIRFAVNTIAPYLLTQRLLLVLGRAGRVINVASAAQSPVDRRALIGKVNLLA